jgi:hypothetical protein
MHQTLIVRSKALQICKLMWLVCPLGGLEYCWKRAPKLTPIAHRGSYKHQQYNHYGQVAQATCFGRIQNPHFGPFILLRTTCDCDMCQRSRYESHLPIAICRPATRKAEGSYTSCQSTIITNRSYTGEWYDLASVGVREMHGIPARMCLVRRADPRLEQQEHQLHEIKDCYSIMLYGWAMIGQPEGCDWRSCQPRRWNAPWLGVRAPRPLKAKRYQDTYHRQDTRPMPHSAYAQGCRCTRQLSMLAWHHDGKPQKRGPPHEFHSCDKHAGGA